MHFSHLKRSTPAQQKSRAPLERERSRALPGRLGLAALAALAIAAGAVVSRAPEAGAAPAQPNFIVLMTDDQTVGELSVMKQTRRRIAGQGVSFDRFVTSYPLCCPSRTTFLTGEYSHNHGVLGNGTPIGGYPAFDKNDSMARWLQKAGYNTI